MNESDLVYLNGELVERRRAAISPFDRGLLYGDGFFETTRIVRGTPLLLGRHLERLRRSCRETGFGDSPAPDALQDGLRYLIEANRVAEGYLRITLSRGRYKGALTELECRRPTVLAEARSMELCDVGAPPPITLAPSEWRRDEQSPLMRHKSLSYQANVLALAAGRRAGADEVYFLNTRGELTEGAISNLFFVRDAVVCTPAIDCGLLPGITREVTLQLCEEARIPAQTGRFAEDELLLAEEAFCTNSLRGLMAVQGIIGHPECKIGAGPLTERLQELYERFVERECSR